MAADPPRKLLVRGVNWLGDAVMTTPALRRLREALPSTSIVLLTRAKLAGLWSGHPDIDAVISIGPRESLPAVARRLRAGAFDAALILPNSPRSALETWLAGIPRRVGYARPWRNWFLTDAIAPRTGHVKMRKRGIGEIRRLLNAADGTMPSRPAASAHQMRDYLRLAAVLGGRDDPAPPRLRVASAETDATLKKFGIGGDVVWLGLNAGAQYGPAKRWPADRFIEAARLIRRNARCGCLMFGGDGDAPLTARIASALQDAALPVHDLAGRTSLRELMALLTRCGVLLTNDSGPMHVAAALGVPVVAPFGSTSPELTGPGLPGDPLHQLIRADAPCAPCFLRECPIDFRCMTGITVERVVQATLRVLAAVPRSP